MITSEKIPVTEPNGVSLSPSKLTPLQIECIDVFVRIAQYLGLAKSYGELYGFMFMSPVPVCLDDCIEQLNLSKGAASQGLKQLRALGAIKIVYVSGERRDHYVAEQNLKYLVAGFLKERVQPGMEDIQKRLETLEAQISGLPEADQKILQDRLHRMQGWQAKAQMVLPAVNKLLLG